MMSVITFSMYAAQTARAGLALDAPSPRWPRMSASGSKFSFTPSISNMLLILLDERVLRLGQDAHERRPLSSVIAA